MTKQGLTDLERGKYLPDGDNEYSVVRVAQTLDFGGADGSNSGFVYLWRYMENAGSRDQNIDASLTPADFSYAFTRTTYVKRIDIVAACVNFITTLDYGSIANALPNGVQIIKKVAATETELFNARRWIQWGHFVDNELAVFAQPNSEEQVLVASCTLNPLWKFVAGEQLVVRIRDDLSILRYHRSSLLLLEV